MFSKAVIMSASLLPTTVVLNLKDQIRNSKQCKKSLELCPSGENKVSQRMLVYKYNRALRGAFLTPALHRSPWAEHHVTPLEVSETPVLEGWLAAMADHSLLTIYISREDQLLVYFPLVPQLRYAVAVSSVALLPVCNGTCSVLALLWHCWIGKSFCCGLDLILNNIEQRSD